jgi:endonuclease YncB( thermonuclease family)
MASPQPNYAHKASFLRAYDGDSFWLEVDFGRLTSGVTLTLPLYLRLYGIDTWELNQPGGFAARDYTTKLLLSGEPIVVQTLKPDGKQLGQEKFGRFLARVWVGDDELAELLRAAGHEKGERP